MRLNTPAPWRRLREGGIHALLVLCAAVSVVTTTVIIVVLVSESVPFFRQVSVWEYLTGTQWFPNFEPRSWGVLPLLWGTVVIAVGALALAVPLGVASAIFLSEYAPTWVRQTLKPTLEILAGVPSVVYGYFALAFVTPYLLRPWLPNLPLTNAASAIIVLAIMVLPTIVSLCDDALRAVPRSLREGAYALAATRLEVSTRVVLPSALSGVFAAVLLALARAIGETMAVTLAAGATPRLTLDLRQSVQTMTAYIVQVSKGDAPRNSPQYHAIYAVGLTLFLITLVVNIVARRTLARFKESYE
jgi:phosphate transport system permease protein